LNFYPNNQPMKHLFTFLFALALSGGLLTPTQAQSRITSIVWAAGQPRPDTLYAPSSQPVAGARVVCQTTLIATGGPTTPVCAGSNLIFTGNLGASNPCGLDSSTPTKIELSNASGGFTNPIVLKTGTGEAYVTFSLFRSEGGVPLPANLPAGTQYVIRLNNGRNGISSSSQPFTIIAAPSVSITASSTALCDGQPAQLTATGANTYTWSTRQTSNPISVTTTGTYSVTGVATNGCSGTATVSILNRALPTRYPIVGSGLYCEGGSGRLVRLAGSQTGVDYQLLRNNNPVGNPVPGTGSALSFGNQTAEGTYTALATYSGSSCQQLMPGGAVIGIAPLPTASLTNNGPLTCSSPSVTLSASGGSTYQFSPGAVQVDNGATATVSSAGIYSVTVTSQGCSAVASTTVSQDITAPSAGLVSSGTLTCASPSATLTASGEGTYQFSAGATQVGTGNTATVATAGTYSVTVTNTATGCTNTASVLVSEDNSQPTVSIDPTTATLTCGLPSVVLTANTSASSLTWSTGQTTPSLSVSVAGTYSVTVTSTNGCLAMAQATVSGTTAAPDVPILTATPTTTTTNQPITVMASGCTGGTINWTAGGGSGQISGNTYTVSQPGNYTLSATCSLNGCTSGASAPLPLQIRPGGFAITGVSPASCQLLDAGRGQYEVRLTPQYADAAGPISFSIVNELSPTTAPGPYTLRLYSDNPMITLVATQRGSPEARFVYHWLAACSAGTSPNRPPVARSIPDQSLPQGQAYSLELANYITDPDGQPLTFAVTGLPADLTLSGSRISGTVATTGVNGITINALDPAGLEVTTQFQLTVTPLISTPAGFTIVGVTTVSCQTLSTGQRQVQFLPQYGGVTGQPITFQVTNELAPTQQAGPYTLNLYTDNPVISLQATQTGSNTPATYRYHWLAGCGTTTTPPPPANRTPVVSGGLAAQTATVGQGYTLVIPAGTFTDSDGDALAISATGLPAGLSLANSTLTGTPSTTGVSTVSLTAADPAGLSATLSFALTVVPATDNPPSADFAITAVGTLRCEVISAGQRRVSFTPQYSGVSSSPISFSVVNELSPTTAPGPYSLTLYTDNPIITLQAQQGSSLASFSYNWLAACSASGRQGVPEVSRPLRVTVLGNPVQSQHVVVEVRGAEGQSLALTLTDQQGRNVSSQTVERAGSVERHTLQLPHPAGGLLLLRVSTSSQSQTVKLIQAD
jgi:hypothetical protein